MFKHFLVALVSVVELAAAFITIYDYVKNNKKHFITFAIAVGLAIPLYFLITSDPIPVGDPINSYSESVMNERGSFQPLSQGSSGANSGSKPVLVNISFSEHWFDSGQKFKVYTAPSSSALYSKTSDGKQAYASTNKEVYVAGWAGKWLLIKYKLSGSNQYRIGYTSQANGNFRSLDLNDYTGTIVSDCYLTDGVDSYALISGMKVKVLGQIDSDIYIETTIKNKQARGTVPKRNVDW